MRYNLLKNLNFLAKIKILFNNGWKKIFPNGENYIKYIQTKIN